MSQIVTASGRLLDYLDPQPDQICIEDIATALSRESRFNGHMEAYYSVAQHSVLVSEIVPPAMALEGLLHDATEAFMKDLPSPLKQLLPDYQRIEDRLDGVIRTKFRIPVSLSPQVKHADRILLATERRDLRAPDGTIWECLDGIEPLEESIRPWSPPVARLMFMDRFRALTGVL